MGHETPFDTIESAHEFVALFGEVVIETKHEIEADLQRSITSKSPRFVEALQIIAYNLATLEMHMKQSRRILNDLRSLRRLIFGERARTSITVGLNLGAAKIRRSPGLDPLKANGSTVDHDVSTYLKVRRRALSSARVADLRGLGNSVPWYVRR